MAETDRVSDGPGEGTVGGASRLERRRWLRGAGALVLGGAALPLLTACGAAAGAGGEPKAPASAVYPADANNPTKRLAAPFAHGPVSIKGVLDASWKNAQKYVLSSGSTMVEEVGSTFNTSPPLTSSTCYLQWDAKNLYVAEDRVQSAAGLPVSDLHVGTQMYLGNSLGVFLANAHYSVGNYTVNGHYTVWGTPRGPKGDKSPHLWLRAGASGQQSNSHPNWPIGATIKGQGYVMTMAIPWSALQARPFVVGKGARLRFTLLATAAGPSGKPWGQIMLVGNGDVPSAWGVLTLQ